MFADVASNGLLFRDAPSCNAPACPELTMTSLDKVTDLDASLAEPPAAPPAAARVPAWRRVIGRFRRDQRGAYATEFAIVAVPFLAMTFTLMETAYAFWANQVLSSALTDASRLVLTGQAQGNAGITDIATFKNLALCPKLPGFINCADILVDVRSAASFAAIAPFVPNSSGFYDTSGFGYQKTNRSDIVVIRAVYYFPVYASFLGAPGTVDYSGKKRLLMAINTFRNEPF